MGYALRHYTLEAGEISIAEALTDIWVVEAFHDAYLSEELEERERERRSELKECYFIIQVFTATLIYIAHVKIGMKVGDDENS